MGRMKKKRLDVLLVERELVSSREKGRRLIMAGQVRVGGELSDKPGRQVPVDASVTIDERLSYVSRGGQKLEAALDHFKLDVQGWVVADVGASTGGFTDCLLQRGASRVYAIDVGYGQLAWSLRRDPRVHVLEGVNARYLEPAALPFLPSLAVVDVSFISLKLVLPGVVSCLAETGVIVALGKPQFEVGRGEVGRGGIVRRPEAHRRVLEEVMAFARDHSWGVAGLCASALAGADGNREFFVHLRPAGPSADPAHLEHALNHAVYPEESS